MCEDEGFDDDKCSDAGVAEDVKFLRITATKVPAEECALLETNDWGTAIWAPTCDPNEEEEGNVKLVVYFP